MPQDPPSHSSRYESLVDAIRRYLATHPAAADTVEGIAGWAVGALASVTADEVHSALSHLEARGEVTKRRAEGGAEVFVRTDAGFRAAPITLGRQDGAMVIVTGGLSGRERIAAANSFTLKSALGAAEAGHED